MCFFNDILIMHYFYAVAFITLTGPLVTKLETWAPVLLLLPWKVPRLLAVIALMGFHVVLGFTLRLNDITVINIAGEFTFVFRLDLISMTEYSTNLMLLYI